MPFRFDGFTRIRAKLELTDKLLRNLVDVNDDAARFPRGAKLRFEFGLFYNNIIIDASQIVLPRLRVLDTSDPDSALALDSNLATVRVNGSVTQEQWDSDDPAMAHIVAEFTASQTAEGVFTTPPVDGDTDHWFILTAGAGADFIASGTVKSFDGGYNPAGGTPPAGGSAATIESIEALLNARLANFVRYVGNPAGATIELTAPSSGKTGKLGLDDEGNLIAPNQVTT